MFSSPLLSRVVAVAVSVGWHSELTSVGFAPTTPKGLASTPGWYSAFGVVAIRGDTDADAARYKQANRSLSTY